MSKLAEFLQAIQPYQDALGFVGGHPVPTGSPRQSDNAGMFTAEYIRICHDIDPKEGYEAYRMAFLLDDKGVLRRYPGDTAPDLSPDNFLGFLNWCSLNRLGAGLANELLIYGVKHFGSYTVPWSKEGFLFRQPQLICAALAASGRLAWWKLYYLPLVLYTALVIAIAGYKASPIDDQDTRRLSWHLLQIMKTKSLLCRLAGRIWWSRLRKQYGDEGMRLVFGRYFNADHPFAKYAVNDWENK